MVEAEVQYAKVAHRRVPKQEMKWVNYYDSNSLWSDIPWGRKYPITAYCSLDTPALKMTVKDRRGRTVKRKINVLFPASEWQKHREIVPYIYFRLCHSEDYRKLNSSIGDRTIGLGYRYAKNPGISLGSIPTGAFKRFETVFWGSRRAMKATVVSKRELDTAHAVIRVKYTRENAEILCRELGRDFSKQCIVENREPDGQIANEIRANCKSGIFSTLYGLDKKYQFIGKSNDKDSPADYVIRDIKEGWILFIGPTGYDVALDNFGALCPKTLKKAKLVPWPSD